MDINEMAGEFASPASNLRCRQCTVIAVNANGTVDLTIAGSSKTVAGVRCAAHLFPVVGQGVWCLTDGKDLLPVLTMAPRTTGWIATGIVAGSGWVLGTYRYRRDNGQVFVQIPFSRSGTSITPDSTGNLTGTDPLICTLPAGYRSAAAWGLYSSGNTRVACFEAAANGEIRMTAVGNSADIVDGQAFNISGVIPLG